MYMILPPPKSFLIPAKSKTVNTQNLFHKIKINKIPNSFPLQQNPSISQQISMAEEEQQQETNKEGTVQSSFPTGRVKRIMKLDKDINKINSEALFVVSNATELFVRFLAEKSSLVAIEKKRKTIKLEHLRLAVKRHQPTADFLLDSLPMPPPPDKFSSKTVKKNSDSDSVSVPTGTRKIDSFFKKGP